MIALEGHHVAHRVTVAHSLSVTGRQRLRARIQTYCLGQSHNTQVWTAIILLHNATPVKVIQRVAAEHQLFTDGVISVSSASVGNERNYNKTKTTFVPDFIALVGLH